MVVAPAVVAVVRRSTHLWIGHEIVFREASCGDVRRGSRLVWIVETVCDAIATVTENCLLRAGSEAAYTLGTREDRTGNQTVRNCREVAIGKIALERCALAQLLRSKAGRSVDQRNSRWNSGKAKSCEHLVEQGIVASRTRYFQSSEQFRVVHHRAGVEVHISDQLSCE